MKLFLLATVVASAFAVLPSVPGLNTPQPTPYPTPAHDTKVAQGLKHAHQFAALGNQNTLKHSDSARGANYKQTLNGKGVALSKANGKGSNAKNVGKTIRKQADQIRKTYTCKNGVTTVSEGWKGACAGKNYCKACRCTAQGLVSNKAKHTCGKPSSGSAVCKNIFCHFKMGFMKVVHKKNQLATEGRMHNCKYNNNSGKCTCFCHGAQNKLWHSYKNWYCATKNGATSKKTHINYTKGTYTKNLPKCQPM